MIVTQAHPCFYYCYFIIYLPNPAFLVTIFKITVGIPEPEARRSSQGFQQESRIK